MVLVGVTVLSVGLNGCGSSEDAEGGSRWGPLAVAEGEPSGNKALLSGTIEITDKCVFLRTGDDRGLLVWPSNGTEWEQDSRTIRYTAGGEVEVRDGDSFSVGGGGDSEAESGVDDRTWAQTIDWAAEPDPACFTSTRYFVGFRPKK